jgi:hypothetical protein
VTLIARQIEDVIALQRHTGCALVDDDESDTIRASRGDQKSVDLEGVLNEIRGAVESKARFPSLDRHASLVEFP